ncbi:N-alpha-acetyltransferase [Acrasis kona]
MGIPTKNLTTSGSIEQDKKIIQSWVNKHMRVNISDGRVFSGRFICVDNLKNVILTDAVEYKKINDEEDDKRRIGLVMLPGEHILSTWIEQPKKL